MIDLTTSPVIREGRIPQIRWPVATRSSRALRFRSQHSVRARLMLLARYRGNDPAYLDARSGEIVTWENIGGHALDWSDQLKGVGVVGLRTNNPAVFCRAYLAALASGVCVVPIDPQATRDELGTMLDFLEVSDIVVDPNAEAEVVEGHLNIWVSSGARLSARPPGGTSPDRAGKGQCDPCDFGEHRVAKVRTALGASIAESGRPHREAQRIAPATGATRPYPCFMSTLRLSESYRTSSQEAVSS